MAAAIHSGSSAAAASLVGGYQIPLASLHDAH